jgi:hypothetical protein
MTVIQLIINLLHHHHQPTTKNYNLFLALIIIINVKLKMRAHSSQSEISEGETKREGREHPLKRKSGGIKYYLPFMFRVFARTALIDS